MIPTGDLHREDHPEDHVRRNSSFDCPLTKILPNADQPRQGFDEKKLLELTESVKSRGVIHPLIVRQHDLNYQIVAGERRWRAAKLAGLKTIPVIVKELTDAEVLELALIENLQREDLNPLEEAEAYQNLIDEHGLTQEELSKRVGKRRSSVANMLRLLRLPAEVRRMLLVGQISMGHARAILGVSGSRAQIDLARRVVKQSLSVRECEELTRRGAPLVNKRKTPARQDRYTPAEFRVVESLQRRLGTKVDLKKGGRGGKVVITYYAAEELERIIAVIEGR
ncbi:MAG TPA: ParB/RepB/Spo0J family partition protein [Myxococcota bacterium]|nr:ParB/RepB/Spo0J family partition protein [Myxococcota bacterium]